MTSYTRYNLFVFVGIEIMIFHLIIFLNKVSYFGIQITDPLPNQINLLTRYDTEIEAVLKDCGRNGVLPTLPFKYEYGSMIGEVGVLLLISLWAFRGEVFVEALNELQFTASTCNFLYRPKERKLKRTSRAFEGVYGSAPVNKIAADR